MADEHRPNLNMATPEEREDWLKPCAGVETPGGILPRRATEDFWNHSGDWFQWKRLPAEWRGDFEVHPRILTTWDHSGQPRLPGDLILEHRDGVLRLERGGRVLFVMLKTAWGAPRSVRLPVNLVDDLLAALAEAREPAELQSQSCSESAGEQSPPVSLPAQNPGAAPASPASDADARPAGPGSQNRKPEGEC